MSVLKTLIATGVLLVVSLTTNAATAVDELLQEYRQQGATDFSATAGQRFWNQAFHPPKSTQERRCASCHTSNLRQPGKHVVTGKDIKPLAPSVLSKRLTNMKKIRKWLRRNCQWTTGRECSAQVKGDVLTFLQQQ
jgi:hypothetical protein